MGRECVRERVRERVCVCVCVCIEVPKRGDHKVILTSRGPTNTVLLKSSMVLLSSGAEDAVGIYVFHSPGMVLRTNTRWRDNRSPETAGTHTRYKVSKSIQDCAHAFLWHPCSWFPAWTKLNTQTINNKRMLRTSNTVYSVGCEVQS